MKPEESHGTVYLYVLDTLADWEIGFITAELHSGRYLSDPGAWTLTLTGTSRAPIETMGGMSITPEVPIGEVDFKDTDVLVLPGADTWMDGSHEHVLDLVPNLLGDGVRVAAICGATVALAQGGILDDRRHTSNDRAFLEMVCPDYSGGEFYEETSVVVDGDLITASGIAPLEFAHALFGELKVMDSAVLDAWYELYRTRDPRHFHAVMKAMS